VTLDLAIRGGQVLTPDGLRPGTVAVAGGRIVAILPPEAEPMARETVEAHGLHVLPGAIDIHCHIRSPAYPNRGSVESETGAAAKGGITTLFEMPITDPCCNSPERVVLRRDHFSTRALTDFAMFAAPVELREAAFEALRDTGVIALKIFTTAAPPGRDREFAGIAWPDADAQMTVLRLAAKTGLTAFVHAENEELVAAATARAAALDKADARTHGLARPPEAEAAAVAALLAMNMVAGARLHIAHVTSRLTVDVLRRFRGTSDFSAETCPHYLSFTENDVARAGVCARINPPVRHDADRAALWEALADGTLAHVTTDHAAFAPEEKAAKEGDFLTAPPGHPGLETLVPTLLDAVAKGKMPMERAWALLSGNAAARFRLPSKGRLAAGADADMIVVDMAAETHITQATLLTNARAISRLTDGHRYGGRILRTILRGATVWDGATITARPGTGRFVTPEDPR
jgi:dihydroorotase (multifunctional complex type)